MKFIFYSIIAFFLTQSYSQSINQNYNHVIEPKVPMSISHYENNSFDPNTDIIESIIYFDGFNTKLQGLGKKMSPLQKDVISFFETDEFGKETKKYFPFRLDQNNIEFVPNAKALQATYYNTKYNDLTPYSEKVYDGSPLNRLVKISKGSDVKKVYPNSSYDKTTKIVYATNIVNEVKVNRINGNGQITNDSFYTSRTLQKSTSKNENWTPNDGDLNTVQVFTDNSQRKIAEIGFLQENNEIKKLITQYVYDEKGLLRYVLSPKMNKHSFQAYYNSNTLKFNYKKFLLSENVSGGGSDVTVSLNSGVLSVTFNCGFQSTPLKTGQIVYLDDRIPNSELGNLLCTSCTGNYRLYTENGYLCIGVNTSPISTTGLTGVYTANIGVNFNFISDQEILDKFAYQYNYDEFNRLIEQKAPGKGWEYTVYDQLDRPILTQDQNLKAQGKWLFTKYDVHGRVVYTGDLQSSLDRISLQTQLENHYLNNPLAKNFESRVTTLNSIGGLNINYTNNSFPTSNIELMSLTYYDDYNFVDVDKPTTPVNVDGQYVTTNVRGLKTCNIQKILGENSYSKIFYYFDEKTRIIYTLTKNFLGGYTKVETKYNFRGKVERTKTYHKKDLSTPSDLIIETRFTYDHAERITGEFKKVNYQSEQAIVQYVYDDLGNLYQKKVGGLSSSITPLQQVTFTENILGQLTKVNDPNNMGNNLFAYEVKYHNPDFSGTPTYNGNISQVTWKNSLPNSGLEKYFYQYDQLNRLKSSSYTNSNNPSSTNCFFENISYDENGNITFLHRAGDSVIQPNLEWMDYMNYSYDGNKLIRIDELGHGHIGYLTNSPQNPTGSIYEYDANGNLTRDRNKGIDYIIYNNLNLVKEVIFENGGILKFKYNASGEKVSKEYTINSTTTTTLYIDGFQYQNNVFQFFNTTEGYVVNSGGNYKYIYIYRDHLGNNRLSYSDLNSDGTISNSEILSSTDYYALGMVHSGEFTSGFASGFLYKFQGKEFDNEGNLRFYDFGSRMYDPCVGRWWSPDPQNQFISPYVAFGNNPVLSVDPNGEWAIIDDVIAIVVGGVVNVVANALQGNINSWGDGFAYFGTGALAGEATLYGGPVAGAMVLGAGNNIYNQYKANGNSFKNFDYGQLITTTAISGISAHVGGIIGEKFSQHTAGLFSKIPSQLASEYIAHTSVNTATGFVIGTGTSLLNGNTMEESLKNGANVAGDQFVISTVTFGLGKAKGYITKTNQENQTQQTEESKVLADSKNTKFPDVKSQEQLRTEFKALDDKIKAENDVIKAQKTAAEGKIPVTEATIRTALEGSNMKTTQSSVSLPAVERYVRMLENGQTPPAIKVGDGVIIDGNHRYISGRLFQADPAIVPGTISPSQIINIKPIQEIKIDLNDWGNH